METATSVVLPHPLLKYRRQPGLASAYCVETIAFLLTTGKAI